eukprot:7324793-Prymnesium_polylepis.1
MDDDHISQGRTPSYDHHISDSAASSSIVFSAYAKPCSMSKSSSSASLLFTSTSAETDFSASTVITV